MAFSKGVFSASLFVVLLLGAGVGCSLMLDTDYDKYGPVKKVSGTGGTGGSTEAGTPDVDPGGAGGAGGHEPFVPPPAGEVCPFWQPPSCAGGLTCAGADCCESRSVPGGSFLLGDDSAVGAEPEHNASIASLCFDTFEVSVGRFRKYVEGYVLPEEDAGAHPAVPGSGWQPGWNTLMPSDEGELRSVLNCNKSDQTWTNDPAGNEDKPLNCVTWYEAFAFCAWDGGRLASEAEWEYAATGGSQNRLFPWGPEEPNAALATYCATVSGIGLECLDTVHPIPVGNTPLGSALWGQQDMAGNVWEWNLDWFSQAFYQNICSNCVNISAPGDTCLLAAFNDTRVARGGAFRYGRDQLRSFARGCNLPSYRGDEVGFRCVRDL